MVRRSDLITSGYRETSEECSWLSCPPPPHCPTWCRSLNRDKNSAKESGHRAMHIVGQFRRKEIHRGGRRSMSLRGDRCRARYDPALTDTAGLESTTITAFGTLLP